MFTECSSHLLRRVVLVLSDEAFTASDQAHPIVSLDLLFVPVLSPLAAAVLVELLDGRLEEELVLLKGVLGVAEGRLDGRLLGDGLVHNR